QCQHASLRCLSLPPFFFPPPAPPALYTLSLHDALPIFCSLVSRTWRSAARRPAREIISRSSDTTSTSLGVGSSSVDECATNRIQIGRAHVLTPVTWPSRMPSSASKKKSSTTRR